MSDTVYEKHVSTEDIKVRKTVPSGDFYGEDGTITNFQSIGGGSGGIGTLDHRVLTNRSAVDSHPQSAITGLGEKFNEINTAIAEYKSASLTATDIVDNLTTKDPSKALSANQGSLLEEQISDLAQNIAKTFHIQDDEIPTKNELPTSLTEADEGKAYIVLDTGYMYIWTGSSYKQVNGLTDLSNYYTKTQIDTRVDPLNDHTQNLEIHVTPTEKTLVETIPTLTDTVNTDVQNLFNHRNSDRYKWMSSWNTELDIYEELAKSQGLKPDPDNDYVITTGDTYTVPNPHGGLLKMTTINIDNGFTIVSINGVQAYTSEGSSDNLSYIKYLRVLYSDVISVTSSGGNNVITLTPAIPDPDSPLMKYNSENEKRNTENTNRILNLEARFENKTLSGVKTDIEAQAQSASGYTVNNSLGGRITGYGVNAILGSTGQVNVNHSGEITEVYNNLGLLSLLAPVPALVEDVADGDIVTSTGMSSLFFEPYVSASA